MTGFNFFSLPAEPRITWIQQPLGRQVTHTIPKIPCVNIFLQHKCIVFGIIHEIISLCPWLRSCAPMNLFLPYNNWQSPLVNKAWVYFPSFSDCSKGSLRNHMLQKWQIACELRTLVHSASLCHFILLRRNTQWTILIP